MKESRFPKGWDEDRVKRVLAHYESLSEDEATAEDEAAWEDSSQTFMEIPNDLVSTVRELIAKRADQVRTRLPQTMTRLDKLTKGYKAMIECSGRWPESSENLMHAE